MLLLQRLQRQKKPGGKHRGRCRQVSTCVTYHPHLLTPNPFPDPSPGPYTWRMPTRRPVSAGKTYKQPVLFPCYCKVLASRSLCFLEGISLPMPAGGPSPTLPQPDRFYPILSNFAEYYLSCRELTAGSLLQTRSFCGCEQIVYKGACSYLGTIFDLFLKKIRALCARSLQVPRGGGPVQPLVLPSQR